MNTKIVQKLGSKSPVKDLRFKNINWVVGLNRDGLEYKNNVVLLNLHKTEAGEIVGIKYPEKESNSSNSKVFKYDLRPKVLLKNGNYVDDLSFYQIWDASY
jgi:hypothetical protein